VTKKEAAQQLIAALNSGVARRFQIGLVGYYIDGRPYAANALTMDGHSTLDVIASADGFSSYAFFSPNLLAPETVAEYGVQHGPDGTPFVTVRLEVKLCDVFLIAEDLGDHTDAWYFDQDVLATRMPEFRRLVPLWQGRRAMREH